MLAAGRQRLLLSDASQLLPVAVRATERLLTALEHTPPARCTDQAVGDAAASEAVGPSTRELGRCLDASLMLLTQVWFDAAQVVHNSSRDGSRNGGSPAASMFAGHLPHLDSTLAALHRLFSHVAAAAGAAVGSPASSQPASAMAAVARRVWHALAWQEIIAHMSCALTNVGICAPTALPRPTPEHAATAASCAVAALRLAPLLPQLPLFESDGADAPAAPEAAAGVPAGSRRLPPATDEDLLELNPPQHLAETLESLAHSLLVPLANELRFQQAGARLATAGFARALFEAAATACSAEWAAAGSEAAAAAGAGSPPVATPVFVPSIAQVLHLACLAAVGAHIKLLKSGGGEEVHRCAG